MDVRYIAGLFDGDGCCWYSKSPRINLTNLHYPTLLAIRQRYGFGTLYQDERNGAWVWAASGDNALEFLDDVYDHLYIKQRQALILKLIAMSVESKASRAHLDNELRSLKRKRYDGKEYTSID